MNLNWEGKKKEVKEMGKRREKSRFRSKVFLVFNVNMIRKTS